MSIDRAHGNGRVAARRVGGRSALRAVLHLLTIIGAGSGIWVAVILVKSHLDVYGGGLASGLFCGGDSKFDCGAVSAHPSSWLLGFPVPVWGLMFYIMMSGIGLGALMMRGADRKAMLAAGSLFALLAVLFDVYLAIVMVKIIGTVCLNCVVTYGINFGLLVSYVILDRGTKEQVQWSRLLPSVRALVSGAEAVYYRSIAKGALLLVTFTAGGLVLWSVLQPLGEIRAFGEQRIAQFIANLDEVPEVDMAVFDDLPRIPEGLPNAAVQVVLVGDFQCSFCRSLASTMDRLYKEHPDDIKMVFVHSPVNSECNAAIPDNRHPDACWLAQAAECAAEQHYFWRFHRFLFQDTPFPKVSRDLVLDNLDNLFLNREQFQSCMDSGRALESVERDVALCGQLGLTVTPSLVINGQAMRGSVFPWMLRRMVEATLAHELDRPAIDMSAPGEDAQAREITGEESVPG